MCLECVECVVRAVWGVRFAICVCACCVCLCVCVMLCGARGVWVVSDVRVVRVCVCALCFGVCVVQAACV